MDQLGESFVVNPLEDYPLDGIDLDRRVNDVLGVPSVSSYQPENDVPGIRFSKYIPLDEDGSRMLEFFVETKISNLPKNFDGYELDEVKMISGVMMRRRLSDKPHSSGYWKLIEQYIPEERFIEEFLSDKVARIRAARWFAEFRAKATFDDETMDSINSQFVPTLSRDPTKSPFRKDLH